MELNLSEDQTELLETVDEASWYRGIDCERTGNELLPAEAPWGARGG